MRKNMVRRIILITAFLVLAVMMSMNVAFASTKKEQKEQTPTSSPTATSTPTSSPTTTLWRNRNSWRNRTTTPDATTPDTTTPDTTTPVTPTSSSGSGTMLVGVDYWSGTTRSLFRSRDLPFMTECGIEYLRLEFATDRLTNLDSLVPEVVSRGYKVIGLLIRKDLAKTNNVNTWGTWVYNTVNRYKGYVHVWECWNEPNLNEFFPPTKDPIKYTNFLKRCYTEAKRADPTCTVLGGSICFTQRSSLDFLTVMYQNGANDYMDALSYHPYCQPYSPENTGVSNAFTKLETAVRPIMTKYGAGNKKIWITEVGWATKGTPSVTEDKQALYIQQALSLAKSWGWVETFIVYQWKDSNDFYKGLCRDRSSRCTHENFCKPSFFAVKEWIIANG